MKASSMHYLRKVVAKPLTVDEKLVSIMQSILVALSFDDLLLSFEAVLLLVLLLLLLLVWFDIVPVAVVIVVIAVGEGDAGGTVMCESSNPTTLQYLLILLLKHCPTSSLPLHP